MQRPGEMIPHPPDCIASGPGVPSSDHDIEDRGAYGFITTHMPQTFGVRLHNAAGQPLNKGGWHLTAWIEEVNSDPKLNVNGTIKTRAQPSINNKVEVLDCANGTYVVNYCTRVSGSYLIHVSVNDATYARRHPTKIVGLNSCTIRNDSTATNDCDGAIKGSPFAVFSREHLVNTGWKIALVNKTGTSVNGGAVDDHTDGKGWIAGQLLQVRLSKLHINLLY